MSKGIDFEVLKENLYDWVLSLIQRSDNSLSIWWKDQGNPQPNGPYVNLSLSGPFKIGEDTISFDGCCYAFTVSGTRRMILSIQVFGKGAKQDLSTFMSKTELPESNDILRSINVSISNQFSVGNITSLLETTFEERAIMDIELYVSSYIESNVSRIENFTGVGVINDEEFNIEIITTTAERFNWITRSGDNLITRSGDNLQLLKKGG